MWGAGATPNGTVMVALSDTAGTPVAVTANATGEWNIDLASRQGSTVAVNITAVDSTTKRTSVLQDVLFGDVWGCHGQSNPHPLWVHLS